jgi:hypothetical protein
MPSGDNEILPDRQADILLLAKQDRFYANRIMGAGAPQTSLWCQLC